MATRASARIKNKGQPRIVLDDSDCANQDSDDETGVKEASAATTPAPKKKPKAGKKQKTGKTSTEKKVHQLEAFSSMPFDILCLIMEQTDPKTLLAMSRTCSILRSILHSPRGKTVWKCAREQVGLSALQRPDVPEWEFASLLFDSGCGVCGSARASKVNYVHFARACEKCMEDNSEQRKNIKKSLLHPRAFEMVPYSLLSPPSFSAGRERHFWWKPRLERATFELNELEADPVALARLIESRNNIQDQAQADETMINRWHWRCAVLKVETEKERKTIRLNQILAKLRDLGYEEQDLQSPDLAHHPDVYNSQTLTDSVWKRIRPILKRFLDSYRSERLEKEALERIEQDKLALKQYYNEWVSGVPETYCYPPFEKFLTLPSVAALYEPDDESPMAQRLSSANSTISQDIRQYAIEFEENVRQNLLVAYKTLDPAFEDHPQALLMLCTSVMFCPCYWNCKTITTFPAILDHYRRCAGARASIQGDLFTTSPAQIQAIRQIIVAVNTSPSGQRLNDSCSIDELLALGDRFDCVTCEDAMKDPLWYTQQLSHAYQLATRALSWTSMVWHIKCMHHSTPPEIRYIPQISPELEPRTPEQTDQKEAAE